MTRNGGAVGRAPGFERGGAPSACKDVSQVVQSVENAGLARRVARMRPLGVVKG
ncbi:MAG: RtcB family protein [Thermoplasmatota archaeon]